MRTMLRWMVPVEKGNEAIANGSIHEVIQTMLRELKPEAAYFYLDGGKRSGMMVFDMVAPPQIAQIAEPLFQTFNGDVEILPVMNEEDLQEALSRVAP